MLYFVLFVIGIVFIINILNVFLKKKYKIEVDHSLNRYINNTHKWGERILLVGFISLLIIVVYIFHSTEIYFIFAYAILMFGFRAYMEYKYEREEREYILTSVWTIGAVVVFIGSIFLSVQLDAPDKELEQEVKSIQPEMVQQIEIVNYSMNDHARTALDMLTRKREVIIEDNQMIESLLKELSSMELKLKDVRKLNKENYYHFDIKGKSNVNMTVYDNYLFIHFGDSAGFKVEDENSLFQMLNEGDIDWAYPE